jgi:uncharacterized protein involved in exopolysaccharide biosynthesis
VSEKNRMTSSLTSEISSDSEGGLESFVHFFELLWKYHRIIIKIVVITMVITAGLSFLIPNKYSSSTIILPDIEILSAAQQLGSLQQLASSVGITAGVTSPSQLYPNIILSETILRPIIYHKYKTEKYDTLVNLIQFWEFDDEDENLNYEDCLEKLREKVISIDVDKETFVMTVTVETTEPKLSADIANNITSQLDSYQRYFRSTNASEQRKFLESRIEEVKKDLTTAEEALKNFREKNRKIVDSPELLLEQTRLQRDVELNSTMFIELKKQYELAKLEEIKNTPVVQVLDTARPAAEKSSPKRTILVLVAGFLCFIFTTTWLVASDYMRQMAAKDANIARLQTIVNEFQAGLGSVGRVIFRRRKKQEAEEKSIS